MECLQTKINNYSDTTTLAYRSFSLSYGCMMRAIFLSLRFLCVASSRCQKLKGAELSAVCVHVVVQWCIFYLLSNRISHAQSVEFAINH